MTDRRRKQKRQLPKWVTEFPDRHGKRRIRFRRKGFADYYFKAPPGTDAFWVEYSACLTGEAAPRLMPGAKRTKPGSIDELVVRYLASAEFLALAASSRRNYRRQLDAFRAEFGSHPVALLGRAHVKALVARKASTPHAANNLLDRLRVLMRFAVDIEMRKDDPTAGVRGYKVKSDGFYSWSDEDLTRFEAAHPVGTRARLAFALLLYTGQRRSDVVLMGWQHVRDNRISVVQQKTGARLRIRIHPRLAPVLDATSRDDLTFLRTAAGLPFTSNGFGNWFREQCDAAGLPQCSAHGLRKAAARRLAEAGCTQQQIKAITGHRTDAEVARYTAAADQQRQADDAIDRLARSDAEQEMSTQSTEVRQNEG